MSGGALIVRYPFSQLQFLAPETIIFPVLEFAYGRFLLDLDTYGYDKLFSVMNYCDYTEVHYVSTYFII